MKNGRVHLTLLVAAAVSLLTSAGAGAADDELRTWGYRGEPGKIAPADWPDSCQTGNEQSPIDISRGSTQPADAILIQYGVFDSLLRNSDHDIQIVDFSGGIVVRGLPFRLCEIHFHTPSEHTVNNVGTEAEAHFVHKANNCLATTPAAIVIGARIVEAGAQNPPTQRLEDYLAKLDQILPQQTGPLSPKPILESLVGYYQYQGSLTSPGCAQGITWFLPHQTLYLSSATLERLRRFYPNNARPGQRLGARTVRGMPGG
jgi:carbonic anhydrase